MRAINFTILGACIFCFACFLGSCHENGELRDRLSANEQMISQMRKDHDLAIKAANDALAQRSEIHAEQTQKACAAENACSDLDSIPLPHDLRELLKETCKRKLDASNDSALSY